MNTRIERKADSTKIYINDLLHLYIADRIVAIQSWKNENTWWKIEIQTKHNTVLLEYDSFEKWKTILELIDKEL